MIASDVGGVVLPEAAAAAAAAAAEAAADDLALLAPVDAEDADVGTPEWTESDPGDISAQSSFSRISWIRKRKLE